MASSAEMPLPADNVLALTKSKLLPHSSDLCLLDSRACAEPTLARKRRGSLNGGAASSRPPFRGDLAVGLRPWNALCISKP